MGFDQLVDWGDFVRLLVRLTINLAFVSLVVRAIYLRLSPRSDFAFSCMLLNVMTFAVCMLLRKVPVELGFALGLFGVFGILRYRTDAISTRDLTYLFISLGLGMLNAVANRKVSLVELVFINLAIVGSTAVLEYGGRRGRREVHSILYDNLSLLKPGRAAELRADLQERIGLDVVSHAVSEIDLLRDCARLHVTCQPEKPRLAAVDTASRGAPPLISAGTSGLGSGARATPS